MSTDHGYDNDDVVEQAAQHGTDPHPSPGKPATGATQAAENAENDPPA